MIDLAQKRGLTNDDTVKCSQELDQLLYQYQVFFHRKPTKVDHQKNKLNFIYYTSNNRIKMVH